MVLSPPRIRKYPFCHGSILDQCSWMGTIGLKIFCAGAMILKMENVKGATREEAETVAIE